MPSVSFLRCPLLQNPWLPDFLRIWAVYTPLVAAVSVVVAGDVGVSRSSSPGNWKLSQSTDGTVWRP